MRLALVISSLGGGGAERVMSLLASAWAENGEEVSLITFARTGQDTYPLHRAVQRIGLDLVGPSHNWAGAVVNNIRRVLRLRKVLRSLQPDVVVSFMTETNVLAVLAAIPCALPVVVGERTSPDAHRLTTPWSGLRRYAYRRAAAVVAQTESIAAWLRDEVPGARIHFIPNPVRVNVDVEPDAIANVAMAVCRDYKTVLAVGRLSKEKGFDLLLRAFSATSGKHPDWRLVVLGEGQERLPLERLARDLGVADRILIPGFSKTPHVVMGQAELFVLSSRYEGMPGALLEAMACGCPCISFNCRAGPAELIEHGTNGWLVPAEDVAALTAAMERLMDNQSQRERLGGAARNTATAYSVDATLRRWEETLTTILYVRPKERNTCAV